MKLINPRGKEVEFNKIKAERILNNKSKRKQGWVSKDEIEAIETEKLKKLHLDRVELIGDLAKYIEGFSGMNLSNLEDSEFDNLLKDTERLKIKRDEEVRIKAENDKKAKEDSDRKAEELRLQKIADEKAKKEADILAEKEKQNKIEADLETKRKAESKAKSVANLKNQNKPTEKN